MMTESARMDTTTATEHDRELLAALERELGKLMPILLAEGGDPRIASVLDGVARIDLNGGCEGCGSGVMAMSGGLRLMLLERTAGLRDVVFA